MSIVLELPANVETDFARVASQRGVSLKEAAQIAVSDWTERNRAQDSAMRRAAVDAAFGCARSDSGVDWVADFNAEKQDDIDRENARGLI